MLTTLQSAACVPHCCGKEMEKLTANTVDASREKHVPAVTVEGSRVHVKVGSAPHPMTEAHYIQWIYLVTRYGGQFRRLTPSDAPEAVFELAEGDAPAAAYEYCNLHGLWKADI
ncbi:MAG: desulfoferrodoxin [Schwartzia sp.]|nr:desulfoferrodoxin [Schwartzia sp. (in: firmicutes)]